MTDTATLRCFATSAGTLTCLCRARMQVRIASKAKPQTIPPITAKGLRSNATIRTKLRQTIKPANTGASRSLTAHALGWRNRFRRSVSLGRVGKEEPAATGPQCSSSLQSARSRRRRPKSADHDGLSQSLPDSERKFRQLAENICQAFHVLKPSPSEGGPGWFSAAESQKRKQTRPCAVPPGPLARD